MLGDDRTEVVVIMELRAQHSQSSAALLAPSGAIHGGREGTPDARYGGNNERRIREGKPGAPARGVSLSPTTISKIQDSFIL